MECICSLKPLPDYRRRTNALTRMHYPDESFNRPQAEMLASLPPAEREAMARLFRIGNVAFRHYHRQTIEPSAADYKAWLATLNPAERFGQLPFEEGKTNPAFRVFIAELYGLDKDAFMERRLSPADFAYYQQHRDEF